MKQMISMSWLHIKNNKLLCVKTKGKDKFFIPGGKPEAGECNELALQREIKEELNVSLDLESIHHEFTINDIAYGLENTELTMYCYKANHIGQLEVSAEIEVLCWLGLDDIELCAPAAQKAMKRILDN